jgi:hypothetical protein
MGKEEAVEADPRSLLARERVVRLTKENVLQIVLDH